MGHTMPYGPGRSGKIVNASPAEQCTRAQKEMGTKRAFQPPEQPFAERALTVLADLGPHRLLHLAEDDRVDVHGLEDGARERALYTEHGPSCDLVAARHAEHARCVRAAGLRPQHAGARVAVAAARRC